MRTPVGPGHPAPTFWAPPVPKPPTAVCVAVFDVPLRAEQKEQDSRVYVTPYTSQLCHWLAGCVP